MRRPVEKAIALRFGTLVHTGLEAWATKVWVDKGIPTYGDRLTCALGAMGSAGESDPFELVKAEELLLGYTAQWGDEPLDFVAVEAEFDAPLVNPETGKASTIFRLGGKVDAIARHGDGRLSLVEHKTSGEDLSVGSRYWKRISAMDTQLSHYLVGARSLGFDVKDILYDVIRKVSLKPYKATPVEDRKYTQEKSKACPICKQDQKLGLPLATHVIYLKDEDGEPSSEQSCNAAGRIITDPGGRLFATQRAEDETPEEYRIRIREHIIENVDKYFARGTVVRLEDDEREYARDIWDLAALIREAGKLERYPRNGDACVRYGRDCDFMPVCSGETSIENDALYRTALTAHEELGVEEIKT